MNWTNPFKKKKAHRIRGYQPTKEEMQKEFDRLLQHRVGDRVLAERGKGMSLIEFFEWRDQNGNRIQKEEREKLMAELKEKGYSRVTELTRQPGQDIMFKKIIGGKHD
jgi:hypothetical protein